MFTSQFRMIFFECVCVFDWEPNNPLFCAPVDDCNPTIRDVFKPFR